MVQPSAPDIKTPPKRGNCALFCNEPFCIQCGHEGFVRRAGYCTGLADRVVADDIGEAGCVLVYSRRIYEGLDGLYQRFTALAGYVEGRPPYSPARGL